ncbi:Do family serine endopeptidase [Rhodobacteraceae bacterium W635]|uniref:Do family serine endopeptidase n=1 Tax=Nioella halotolerans TaxID=2303578 RepID=UPI000E3CB7B2|nr:Do family serine endopeptidase [Rhodobacteraceae bacterium W635]
MAFYHLTTLALIVAMALAMVVLAAQPGRAQTGGPGSFAGLVDEVGDAVVNITTTSLVASGTRPGPQVPPGSPLEDFFNDFLERQQPGRPGQPGPMPRRPNALGSGFVISEDGYIVTNNHVIEQADEIMVEFRDGPELPAEVIGTDPNTDIALLKVDPDEPLDFVNFGNSDAARVGDWVMAVGNPLGQGFSVSVGIVSARGRALSGTYDDFIQTDAAINRGNSGGPLFNMDGEVVGVNTAILSPNGGSIGIGFSMASNVVSGVVTQLQEFGETRRGWLGVRIQDVTPEIAEGLGLDAASGALVTDVPDGPARDGGVEVGDVITSFDGVEVNDTRELVRVVADAPVGETVRVVVLREGVTETLRVTLGRRETAEGQAFPDAPGAESPEPETMFGLTLAPLTDEARDANGIEDGLLVTEVDPASEAAARGLEPGDVITEVGQQPVDTIAAFRERVDAAEAGGQTSVLLLIRRAGTPRFVALPVAAK